MTGRINPWTPEQLALLQKLRADGIDWPEVSQRCGHPLPSCRTTMTNIRKRQARIASGELSSNHVAFGKGDPKNPKRYWTETDVQTLIRMVTVEGKTCVDVDRTLGRAEGASAEKFNRLRRPEATGSIEVRAVHAPKYLPQHGSITAAFFGDPLPGRSALDQRSRETVRDHAGDGADAMRVKIPSESQARRLAGLFADGSRYVSVSASMSATERVLHKNNWVASTGDTGVYPSGGEYSIFKISDAGLTALEWYLRNRRMTADVLNGGET